MDSRPIGVFDSGLGGVSVLSSLEKKLPNESFIYYGDTARCPYGNKTQETIIRYSRQIIDFLLKKDVKCIVVACNTASAYALEFVQKIYDIPIVGVVLPTVQWVVDNISFDSKSKIILLATSSTIESGVYQHLFQKYKISKEKLHVCSCPLLVPLVEEKIFLEHHISSKEYYQGDFVFSWRKNSNSLTEYLQTKPKWNLVYQTMDFYLRETFQLLEEEKNRNFVLLGCTHYPYLLNLFKMFYGNKNIEWIQSAESTADYVQKILYQESLLSEGVSHDTLFYFSDSIKQEISSKFSSTNMKSKNIFQIAHMFDILEREVNLQYIFDCVVLS